MRRFLILMCWLVLAGCANRSPVEPSIRGNEQFTPTVPIPEAVTTATTTAAYTAVPSDTVTPTFTVTPTATQEPVYLQAVLWEEDPYTPILNYHRFIPDRHPYSSGTKLRLSDFWSQLERLHAAGYSLISLDAYMNGDLRVPAGRRPLILTIDDAFFADQLSLTSDGQPSPRCGVGMLLEFSRQHPDFGFAVAMFANYGDKLFGNIETNDWWVLGEGWEDALANTIAWGIQNEVMPYNHLYLHPRLDLTDDQAIHSQAWLNDKALRDHLARIGQEQLIAQVENYIALPYGVWPATRGGRQLLMAYTDPEGRPVRAVLEAGYEYQPRFAPPPYAPEFDRFHLPRLSGIERSINVLEEHSQALPAAQLCEVGPFENSQPEKGELLQVLAATVQSGRCAQGVFILESGVFRVQDGAAAAILLVD